MLFYSSLLVLSASSTSTQDKLINYQTPGYCGVPVVPHNHDLFENLPVRTSHTLSQNTYKQRYQTAGDGTSASGSRIIDQPHSGPPNRMPHGGLRLPPKPQEDPELYNTVSTTKSPQSPPLTNPYKSQLWEKWVRIVKGQSAKAGSWPWQVHLSICGKWNGFPQCNYCGGSIVASKFIVTAAHCVPEGATGTAMLGAQLLSHGGKKQIEILKFTPHPSWNFPSKFDNDIAVLELAEEFDFTEEMSPICLPQESVCFTEGTPCVVTGWGLTGEHGGQTDSLQEVAVKLIDRERCRQYSGYNELTDRMICAGYESGGRDACGGDSGGPLVCRAGGKNGPWVLYGIVSWGYGCARPGNPGVYAFVPSLVHWVQEMTGLSPVMKMKECYDGVIDKRVPVPTVQPKIQSPARSDHREQHPFVFRCDDPNGQGQFHTGSGVFKTARYPKAYANNQHCYYCVSPDKPGNYVKVTINEIQLDQKKNCHRKGDYLFVEPANKEGYYLCQVKRNPKDTHVIINSDTICLRFVSDAVKARAGLSATFTQILSPPSGCGGDQIVNLKEMSTSDPSIKSLNYPEKYPDRVADQCSWLLRTDETGRFKIHIDFRVLQLEKQDKSSSESFFCQDSDQLIVYGSSSCEPAILEKAPILYVLCGHYRTRPPQIDVSSQSACVVFKINGDSSRNGNGFHANVKLIRRTG